MMETGILSDREEEALIWDYFKPRHTHAWNMLALLFPVSTLETN